MKVLVWNEFLHEKTIPRVTEIYQGGLHEYIKSFVQDEDVEVVTATLDDENCGISEELLSTVDVVIWWGHMAHAKVPDSVVDMLQKYILSGMGLICLHSAHHSKIFKRLMGTTCNLKWRDGARERLWVVKPNHPIAAGVPETFVLDPEEMYGEAFDIPEPQEVIFLGWFNGGEVFRSGCTFVRGNGKIFYFQPGHETNLSLTNPHVQRIIKNAVRWACPVNKNIPLVCPQFQPLENETKG